MMDGQIIKKTASDMAQYLRDSSELIRKFASVVEKQKVENEQLRTNITEMQKRASAPAIQFDAEALKKTASAICECYVGRTAISPEDLATSFQQNPNAVLNVLQKLANEKRESVITGSGVGVITKSASAKSPEGAAENNRRSSFWTAYNNETN